MRGTWKVRAAAVAGAAVALAAAVASPAAAWAGTERQLGSAGLTQWCARKFDEAQRHDMESFRDFDRVTWEAGHDDDAITIYSTGRVVQGREAIGESQRNHFNNRNATWTWTEKTRAVDGCSTGTIVYDATYTIPSQGFAIRQIINVTYTFKYGRWLSVIDQGTQIPL
jgi:hypothetical protein